MDREKIIEGLKWCIRADKQCVYALVDCPYVEQCKTGGRVALKQEALEYIESLPTDAVSITWRQGKAYCGNCGKRIPTKINAHYCHKCGRKIKG